MCFGGCCERLLHERQRVEGGRGHTVSTHDMVVPLLGVPPATEAVARTAKHGVVVRRAQTYEREAVVRFVRQRWPDWADAVDCGFSYVPCRIIVALEAGTPVGFAAYDVDYLGLFGPTGVDADRQGRGIGAALLLRCLNAMRESGYLYAIIGAVGPAEFYSRVAGAMSLPSDWPSYTDPDLS